MMLVIKHDLKVKDFPVVKFAIEVPDDAVKVYPINFLSKFLAYWMTDGFIYLYILSSMKLAAEFSRRAPKINFALACAIDREND